jgi:hypothetical protein
VEEIRQTGDVILSAAKDPYSRIIRSWERALTDQFSICHSARSQSVCDGESRNPIVATSTPLQIQRVGATLASPAVHLQLGDVILSAALARRICFCLCWLLATGY